MKRQLLPLIAILLIQTNPWLHQAQATHHPPRLILQITVDGLRGDLPGRYSERFTQSGFKMLMEKGTYYTNAHYRHANTETIVGHTTLATGAYPADHGMVGNLWFDRASGELTYNIEDSEYTMVGDAEFVDKKSEIDPTQKAARSDGRSPRSILTSTLSDEIHLAANGKAKIFAVSVKDRGAVPLAGHAGKAFWFNKNNGQFVSSTYYYDDYPAWVEGWNAKKLADTYKNSEWKLRDAAETYLLADRDDRPFEIDIWGYGRTFPHPFGNDDKRFYTLLTLSPVGDLLTLDFARSLITSEKLGQDEVTDYLSVSFSSTDYINHLFGPSSLEAEDNQLRLDSVLAELFRYVDELVGLQHTIIVLSADHGSPEAPELIDEIGLQATRMSPKRVETDFIHTALRKRFGHGQELVKVYNHPYVYLNHDFIAQKGLDRQQVQEVLAVEIEKIPGIAAVISSRSLQQGDYVNHRLSTMVRNNFHPRRSGDLYIIQEPYHHLVSQESTPLAAMHGSPWSYDTYVPVMFFGANIQAQKLRRLIHPEDIAVTLANCLHVKPPSAAVGEVLEEICP